MPNASSGHSVNNSLFASGTGSTDDAAPQTVSCEPQARHEMNRSRRALNEGEFPYRPPLAHVPPAYAPLLLETDSLVICG